MAASPLSEAPVALLVEADLAHVGALAALDDYERWIAARRVDAPFVLRRIAFAYLQAAIQQHNAARINALRALIAEGDPTAIASVAQEGPRAAPAELGMMAAQGDERSVRELIGQLQAAPDRMATITALADSGSDLAVPPLVTLLSSPRGEERAAAADGLGKLGAQRAIDQIKPLLQDEDFTVRVSAAASLYRLGDDSGEPVLDQMLTSEHAGLRLGAAQALSVRPGGGWLDVARALAANPDEVIRLGAAKLVAPYDHDLAERVLAELGQSGNLAIREEAGREMAGRVANDFAALRKMLRSSDGETAVRAAARILELTR